MGRPFENQRRDDSISELAGLRSPRESTGFTVPISAEGASEVFDLRPRSRRRAAARVHKRGPARFRFVSDD